MKLNWIALLLGLCGSYSQAAIILNQKSPPVSPSGLPPGWSSPEEVKQTILTSQVDSVEKFLSILSPEMYDNPVLLFNSLSRQGASFSQPRVILSHPNGRFFSTFNGCDQQTSGHKIEMIHYNEINNLFEFSEVRFERSGAHFATAEELTRCLACHASAPATTAVARLQGHPIWDSYPDWPNAFGNSHRHGGSGTAPLSPLIEQSWLHFQKTAPSHPRYRYLGLDKINRSDLDTFSSHLGNRIMHTTLLRLAREIRRQPAYPEFADAFSQLNTLLNREFSAHLPIWAQKVFPKENGSIMMLMSKKIEEYFRAKAIRYDYFSGIESPHLTLIRQNSFSRDTSLTDLDSRYIIRKARLYFLLKKIGLSPELTNLTLEKYSYANVQAQLSILNLPQYLANETECERVLRETKLRKAQLH
jgi:hypothetical protein